MPLLSRAGSAFAHVARRGASRALAPAPACYHVETKLHPPQEKLVPQPKTTGVVENGEGYSDRRREKQFLTGCHSLPDYIQDVVSEIIAEQPVRRDIKLHSETIYQFLAPSKGTFGDTKKTVDVQGAPKMRVRGDNVPLLMTNTASFSQEKWETLAANENSDSFIKQSNEVDAHAQHQNDNATEADRLTARFKQEAALPSLPRYTVYSGNVIIEEGAGGGAIAEAPKDYSYVRAYLAARFPATFAACKNVFLELFRRCPKLTENPSELTVLDAGCGPGTATLCLRYLLNTATPKTTLFDISPEMLATAEKIATNLAFANQTTFSAFLPSDRNKTFDLTVAAFLLAEMTEDSTRLAMLESLWDATKSYMIVIERGSPACSSLLQRLRTILIEKHGAKILSPCPHSGECPIATNSDSWCHFRQKIRMSPEMMETKKTKKDIENISFSYFIAQKSSNEDLPSSCSSSRIIGMPLKRGGHVLMDLCRPEKTLSRVLVSKKQGKDVYKEARKASWGDEWVLPVGSTVGTVKNFNYFGHLAKKKKSTQEQEASDPDLKNT